MSNHQPPKNIQRVSDFPPRQQEIARLVGRGFSYAEIAQLLPPGTTGRPPTPITVRNTVANMALRVDIADDNGFTPREKIALIARFELWENRRPTR